MENKGSTKHYKWGNNCDSWVLHDTESLSVKYETMPPNTSEELHYHHNAQQFFFVLNGTATITVSKNIELIKRKQGISIKPKVKHFIKNNTEDVLEFLVISNPNTNNDRVVSE